MLATLPPGCLWLLSPVGVAYQRPRELLLPTNHRLLPTNHPLLIRCSSAARPEDVLEEVDAPPAVSDEESREGDREGDAAFGALAAIT